jgi:hypothetical protein
MGRMILAGPDRRLLLAGGVRVGQVLDFDGLALGQDGQLSGGALGGAVGVGGGGAARACRRPRLW